MYIDPDIITENQESYRPKTSWEWAEQALLQANSKPTKAISQMESIRGVELRWSRAQINLFPSQNCEAALAYSRGQVRNGALACLDCKRGRGPFAQCVILKGYLKGSCSNCHYSAEGARCSLRSSEQQAGWQLISRTLECVWDFRNVEGEVATVTRRRFEGICGQYRFYPKPAPVQTL